MKIPERSSVVVLGVLTLLMALSAPIAHAQRPIDLRTGNAPRDVALPAANSVLKTTYSPGDATLIFRVLALMSNGWFDAIAPYHRTAVGIYSQLGRRPAGESSNNYNRNVAALYASYRVLNSVLPANASDWRAMMTAVGLDPDNHQLDSTTPIGIGNRAGDAVVAARERDGMNQLGDEGGCLYNCRPYANYLNYKPVNTAYELVNPSRWAPYITTGGNGIFGVQQFVTPQYAVTRPYSYPDPNAYRVPVPDSSNVNNFSAYKQQADDVLAASAGLTDVVKMRAELFDNKFNSIGGATLFAANHARLALNEWVHYYFLVQLTAFDAGIAAWNEKYRYDTVRPYSAIPYVYGNNPVVAWGGPGKGTVADLPASQWRPYLNVANHPEYPSGSATFCTGVAQASRRYLGTDNLGFHFSYAPGSSTLEPGATPASTVTLEFPTWTSFADACKQARVDGGVHFPAAVEVAYQLGEPIGNLAYDFLIRHINGQTQ